MTVKNAHGVSEASQTCAALLLAKPQPPCSPLLTCAGPTSLRIRFTRSVASPACTHVRLQLKSTDPDSEWQNVDATSGKLVEGEQQLDRMCTAAMKELVIVGLRGGTSYQARALARNAHGMSNPSSVSAVAQPGVKPSAPCAPILVQAGPHKLLVVLALPPARPPCTSATLELCECGGSCAWHVVKQGSTDQFTLGADTPATIVSTEVVVSGLRAKVKYVARMVAYSALGASPKSALSDPVECEEEEAEITGERSREMKDLEGKKRAVDLEQLPDEMSTPQEKRIKHERVTAARPVPAA